MKSAAQSKSEYIIQLAAELLEDIELRRLAPENLLLKLMNLARITENETIQKYLKGELYGFFADKDQERKKWMIWTGRLTDQEKEIGYWEPLASMHARIESNQIQLQGLRIPDLSYAPHAANQFDHVGNLLNPITAGINSVIGQQNSIKETIVVMIGIRSRVFALMHGWVSSVYHSHLFSAQQETLFGNLKITVDEKLAERCGDALKKIPSISERLTAGDQEAVSHALSSCRRMMDELSDAIQPPTDTPGVLGGNPLLLTAKQTKNRFILYLQNHCASESRRERLKETMHNLYDRTGVGVHADVTPEEARFLFLETYLWIGEILSLPELPPVALPQPNE